MRLRFLILFIPIEIVANQNTRQYSKTAGPIEMIDTQFERLALQRVLFCIY